MSHHVVWWTVTDISHKHAPILKMEAAVFSETLLTKKQLVTHRQQAKEFFHHVKNTYTPLYTLNASNATAFFLMLTPEEETSSFRNVECI